MVSHPAALLWVKPKNRPGPGPAGAHKPAIVQGLRTVSYMLSFTGLLSHCRCDANTVLVLKPGFVGM